jgi:Vault protein inter-alpha-trypsin domain
VMFGSGIWLAPARQQIVHSPTEAREIYYRVHGVLFNTRPAPFEHGQWSRFAEFQFDNDHGGTQVGGRLKGLDLVASRIDGSASGDDAVAYVEWTMEFRNSQPLAREVRLELALPPGGVVSRATLWINGEEREAAYGGRSEVRAAYREVAVQQRRDPLLVTTKGADRALAQAFPVPGNGGTLKFRIGITAPLEITEPSRARLALPAIVDRNFSFAPGSSHGVWIESKQALATSAPGLNAGRIDARLFRVAGSIGDGDLSGTRQVILIERDPDAGRVVARLGEREPILQEVVPGNSPATSALMLVVDGSARLEGRSADLIAALDAIAPTTRVGAIIASEPMRRIAPAPWSDAQKKSVANLLRSTAFYGGQDNAPALADALQTLEREPNRTLLWIHGPQPVSFRGSAALLEQATARLSRLPGVVLYDVEPGPNEALPDAPWAWGTRSLPQTGALRSDLADFFARTSGQTPSLVIRRSQAATTEGLPRGSDHVARLWARDRVLELMRTNPAANRAAAVALAASYQLVTPVSGAVVLESQQQFEASRLAPANQVSVPTVPEPHQWALALIACVALAWLVVRHRRRLSVAQ